MGCGQSVPVAAAVDLQASNDDQLRTQYRALTKKILLAGIELSRFNLNYRLYGMKRWQPIALQYAVSQEAAASGILTLNIVGTIEGNQGRHDPHNISLHNLRNACKAGAVTNIIGAGGSAIALGYNSYLALRSRRMKFDTVQARRYVLERLRAFDALLAERDALVEAYQNHPHAQMAKAEGRILHLLRDAFVNECALFEQDVRRRRVDENTFYV